MPSKTQPRPEICRNLCNTGVINPENLHRPAQPNPATLEQRQDPTWLPNAQYWIPREEVRRIFPGKWSIGFKEISSSTNVRTMIAAVLPEAGFGNKVPILIPNSEANVDPYRDWAPLLLANLNSLVFDFIARQKLHGQTLNLYIIEQLPLLPKEKFETSLGDHILADFVREQVLRLTYTAVDMKPFARDLGYEGEPFVWDEEDRRHRLARLDALFFHLYGLERDEADYVLSTFPIVRRQDEKEHGRFITRDLILAYMNAVQAGDLDSRVQLSSV